MSVQFPVSANQGSQSLPPGGRNPAAGLPVVPPFGRNSTRPPVSGGAYYNPQWFAQNSTDMPANMLMRGGITADGRMGTETRLSKGPGPAAGDMLGRPTNIVRETPSWMSNYTIPDGKIQRELADEDAMVVPQRGMMMIMFRNRRDKERIGRGVESRRYVELNIPVWNYMQVRNQHQPATPDDVPIADDIWRDWSFQGPVRTEEGQHSETELTERGRERLINTVVRGFAEVKNLWRLDGSVQPGTKLWLILKKQHVPGDAKFVTRPDHRPQFAGTETNKGRQRTQIPFQLSFFADIAHDVPPQSALEYVDEFGVRGYGKKIYVGRMANHMSQIHTTHRLQGDLNRNVAAMLAAPMCYVHIDTNDA